MTSPLDRARPATRHLAISGVATIVVAVIATVIAAIILAYLVDLDLQPVQPGPIAILLPLRLAPVPDEGGVCRTPGGRLPGGAR